MLGSRQEQRLLRWIFIIKPLLVKAWQMHQRDWDEKGTEVGMFGRAKCILQMRRQMSLIVNL